MLSFAEFKRNRIHAAIEAERVDLLITSSPECTQYLSGYYPIAPSFLITSEAYCIYEPISERKYYVCGSSDSPNAVEAAVFDKIFTFGTFYFNLLPNDSEFNRQVDICMSNNYSTVEDALVAACRELAPVAKRIAIEERRTPITTWKALEAALNGVELAYGWPILQKIKYVKHPLEHSLLRDSAQIAEKAYLSTVSSLHAGQSEAELFFHYNEVLAKSGAEPYFCVIATDERSAYVDTLPKSDKIIKEGSMLRFDFGCVYQNYRSDLGRMAVLGENKKADSYYKWLREGIEAAKEAARPGVTTGELFDIMSSTVQKGIPAYRRSHCGHGIGVTMYEAPYIVPGGKDILEAGVVLCIETPYYEVGWGGIMLEESILITDNGAEYITSGKHEMFHAS